MNRIAQELIGLAKELTASNPWKELDSPELAKKEMAKEFPKLQSAARNFMRAVKKLFPTAKLKSQKGFSTNYSSVYPYVGIDISSPDSTRSFFQIRAMYSLHKKYQYSSELVLGSLKDYRVEVRLMKEVYGGEFSSGSANGAAKDAIKYLEKEAKSNPDDVMKTIGIDPNLRPDASKPTIKEIEEIVRKNSWLEVDEKSGNDVLFITREHGDTGYEEAGREDINIAKKMGKELLDKYGSNNIRVELEIVDEWVNLSVSIKESHG